MGTSTDMVVGEIKCCLVWMELKFSGHWPPEAGLPYANSLLTLL